MGRKSINQLVIDHRAVSRLHAWIERTGEGDEAYQITDATSRSGTKVNGRSIGAKHPLADGDEIRIGPAKLTFLAGPDLPPGVTTFDLRPEPSVPAGERGVLFDCPCGAPMWAGEAFVGHAGQCQYCGRDITVPARSRYSAKPADSDAPIAPAPGHDHLPKRAPAAKPTSRRPAPAPAPHAARNARGEEVCGVCQSAISQFEETTSCPSCGLTFHAECWAENYGCSAYGCSQVNALKPPESHNPTPAPVSADIGSQEKSTPPDARFPWEFLLLAGSVFSALLGAVTFGVPSLAVAGGAAAYWSRHRGNQRTGIVLLSGVLALLGVVTGAAVSYMLYFGSKRVG